MWSQNREFVWSPYVGAVDISYKESGATDSVFGYHIVLKNIHNNWEITFLTYGKIHDKADKTPSLTWENTPDYFRKAFGKQHPPLDSRGMIGKW